LVLGLMKLDLIKLSPFRHMNFLQVSLTIVALLIYHPIGNIYILRVVQLIDIFCLNYLFFLYLYFIFVLVPIKTISF
jgi:hypothetical protein